ncbi:MAG: hypothetical protein CMJ78_00630 [Planctomycetaceae bacterium]|nr:hypothetical protein [Planctomycetaceae bacterium]
MRVRFTSLADYSVGLTDVVSHLIFFSQLARRVIYRDRGSVLANALACGHSRFSIVMASENGHFRCGLPILEPVALYCLLAEETVALSSRSRLRICGPVRVHSDYED